MRVCRLPENTPQAILQGCTVSGEGGVYHKIAAAETVWVFYLANEVRNAVLFGKAFINGNSSDVNQIIGLGGFYSVLIHTKSSFQIMVSKSHEYAGESLHQRMVSDIEVAAPTIRMTVNKALVVRYPFAVPIVNPSAIFATPPDGGDGTSRLWQGCHNSTISLPVKLAYFAGLPPSPWESVSKFHYHRMRSRHSRIAIPGVKAA